MEVDAGMRLDRLKLMSTGNSGGMVYGDLYASGTVTVKGPFNALRVDADVSTDKDGDLHIALGGAQSSGSSDLLTFTSAEENYIDPYDAMMMEMESKEAESAATASKGDLIARARITATPQLEAFIELNALEGNYLNARGNGVLTLDVQPSRGIMDIGGEYNISSGKYHFAIPNITSKDFNINSGSSIKFGGNLMESDLDIDATYQLRTSINKILADTSSVQTRRMVNCGIGISDKISSPKLRFSIDIPDLDPASKSEFESAINTEDKLQKQFLALVVTGSFLQNEQYGVTNNNSLVFSNMTELMSRGISDILTRMDIPVDLGVGYQQNSSGVDFYDVRLSTELFDNRVEVYGSVGNRQYSTTTNPNGDMVGDLDIDIKLDKSGQMRLNLFSHSADEFTSYLDFSQRNGVGITYQREFHKWKDFYNSIFRKRKKTHVLLEDGSEDGNRNEQEKVTIEISADE